LRRSRYARFWRSTRAATAVEYALIVALIAGVVVAGARHLGGNTNNALTGTGGAVAAAAPGAAGGNNGGGNNGGGNNGGGNNGGGSNGGGSNGGGNNGGGSNGGGNRP
jgi:Flp pilus assembly pilin Flp